MPMLKCKNCNFNYQFNSDYDPAELCNSCWTTLFNKRKKQQLTAVEYMNKICDLLGIKDRNYDEAMKVLENGCPNCTT